MVFGYDICSIIVIGNNVETMKAESDQQMENKRL